MEVRVGKLRNGKATSKEDVTGEMIRIGRLWKLCNMALREVL